MTTFTAPTVVPTGGIVTITAISTTDRSKTANAAVAVGTVTFSQPPPLSLTIRNTVTLIGMLPTNTGPAGIDWTVTCGDAKCGSLSLSHTNSTGSTIYTAPAAVPTGAQVTITATATSDVNAFSSFLLTITPADISISVSSPFTNAPPPPIAVNNMALLTAVVINDPLNAGVDWTVACRISGTGACGTILPTLIALDTISGDTRSLMHTDNNQPAAYVAPPSVPAATTITITAASHTDATKSVTTTIVVSPVTANALLAGQFTFFVTGRDANSGNYYVLAGTLVGDGQGNIVAGEADVLDSANHATAAPTPVTGTYKIGSDGRGQITLSTTGLTEFGNSGKITFSVAFVAQNPTPQNLAGVFVSQNRALLSEADTFGSGTGTLYLENLGDVATANSSGIWPQLPATSMQMCQINVSVTNPGPCPPGLPLSGLSLTIPSLTYTLTLSGSHASNPTQRVFFAGALTAAAAPTGSPLGQSMETTFIGDATDAGAVFPMATSTTTPTIGTSPDNFGRLQFQGVDVGTAIFSSDTTSITNLDAYLIDRNHYTALQSGDANLTLGGYLTLFYDPNVQLSPPSIMTGNFAFTEAGTTAASSSAQSAGGIFLCDSSGNPTSVLDVIPLGGIPVLDQSINTVCTDPFTDSLASARATVTFSGTTGGLSEFAAYPTVDTGVQLIEVDSGGPAGAGAALQQSLAGITTISASSFSGKYASNFLASTAPGLKGFTAQIDSDGVSALSGTADVNSFNATASPPVGSPSLNAALSGSYAADTVGRFTTTLNIATPKPLTINSVCYIADSNTCLLLSLDATAPGLGVLQLQSLGF